MNSFPTESITCESEKGTGEGGLTPAQKIQHLLGGGVIAAELNKVMVENGLDKKTRTDIRLQFGEIYSQRFTSALTSL